MSVNMSVSGGPYSTVGGGSINSIKNLFVQEGESLVRKYNLNIIR